MSSNNIVFFLAILLCTWSIEWLSIFHITLNTHLYLSYSFPYRISFMLIITFLFFINTWVVAVWRRAIFGKFTRGDRELWFKGFASFWFFELSTLLGFVLVAMWMNWGPTPLFSRKFNISRQGFLFELVIFTYLLFLLNLMRISVKLNNWETQVIYVILSLLVLSCLIWRDMLLLIGRDSITLSEGSRWRFIDARVTMYSLLSSAWVSNFLEYNYKSDNFINKSSYTLKGLLTLIDNGGSEDIFKKQVSDSLYNSYQSINLTNAESDFFNVSTGDRIFYPSRVGFFVKRISMWTFFLFLKIWHHLMLFIWWYYYLIRLFSTKKASNTFIAICHFNTYCCFLIILAIYIYCLFPRFVMIFRVFKDKPRMLNMYFFTGWKGTIPDYLYSVLTSTSKVPYSTPVINSSFFEPKHMYASSLKLVYLNINDSVFKQVFGKHRASNQSLNFSNMSDSEFWTIVTSC